MVLECYDCQALLKKKKSRGVVENSSKMFSVFWHTRIRLIYKFVFAGFNRKKLNICLFLQARRRDFQNQTIFIKYFN